MTTVVGPYKTLTTAEGLQVPWYVVPFDKQGRCKGPRTRRHLMETLRGGGFTHVFLFSHGWNNDWAAASKRYESFALGFTGLRAANGVPFPAGYRPLMVGVFWPSTSLVLPWERGPRIAAVGEDTYDALADDFDRSVDALVEDIPDQARERFYALVSANELDAEGARELAALLSPQLRRDDEIGESAQSGKADAEDLAETWLIGAHLLDTRAEASDDDADETQFGTATPPSASAAPEAAGWLSKLDPRHAVRMATVWKMKDRAGTVGANGVGALLADVLTTSKAAVHLVGHSYGCKVMLSAVAARTLPRTVESALLLQPAISHRSFAVDADGKGNPGGYRAALGRVAQPLVSTFSSHDWALTRVFHLAVRRRSDLGEQRIAAGAPSRFAALGGYGPGGMAPGEDSTVQIRDAGEPYEELARDGLKLLALQASRCINGHGDISVPATWWLLHEQMRVAR